MNSLLNGLGDTFTSLFQSIHKIFSKNASLLILVLFMTFLIFGFKLRWVNTLRYITLYLVLACIFPYHLNNKYINSLLLLGAIILVESFFNTFYSTKPEYFDNNANLIEGDDGDNNNMIMDTTENVVEDGDNKFNDNDTEAGTIENVTYADANYEYKMSELDGMIIEDKNEWRIMPKPKSVPLSNKKEYIPQGHDLPLKPIMSKDERLDNVKPPFVDGRKGSKRSMVMFDTNAVSLQCCPSTWSTDRGCVCFSEEQKDFVNKRGGNRTFAGHDI